MDFLKALDEAQQFGVSKEDFIKIWELETKLKQQKEEVKALELKSACIQAQELANFQEVGDQMKSLFEKNQKSQKQQISQLKETLLQQNKAQLEETAKQLENQVTMAAVLIKNDMTELFNQFATRMKSELLQACMDVSMRGQPAFGSYGVQRSEYLQQGKPQLDQMPISSSHEYPNYNSEGNYIDCFPSEDGAILHVNDLENVATSQSVVHSPDYTLPDLPVIVYLSMWFSKTGNMSVELSLSGETGEALNTCRIFTVTGLIKNKNSGSFSSLFEGTSQPLRKPKLNKQMKVKTTVCLSTGSGSYEDVTFEELERRGFVINGSCTIKWFVTSQES